jgi:hypothetical protein
MGLLWEIWYTSVPNKLNQHVGAIRVVRKLKGISMNVKAKLFISLNVQIS